MLIVNIYCSKYILFRCEQTKTEIYVLKELYSLTSVYKFKTFYHKNHRDYDFFLLNCFV